MPIYKGDKLLAGKTNSGQAIEFKELVGTSAEKLEILNDAWTWKSLKTTIIYLYENNTLEFGIIGPNDIPGSSTLYSVYLTNALTVAAANTTTASYSNLKNVSRVIKLTLSNDKQTVTSYAIDDYANTINNSRYLATDVNYSTPYMPAYNGSPTTKKYVDDSIVAALNAFSFKDHSIYTWDGQSSSDNSDNIRLFQEILDDHNNGKSVLILRSQPEDDPGEWYSKAFIFDSNIGAPVVATNHTSYFIDGTPLIETNILGSSNSIINYSYTRIAIRLNPSDITEVTAVDVFDFNGENKYLAINRDYTIPYTPLYDGSPATKKYVDDGDANFLSKTNTTSYVPSADYHPATKKYVDDAISTNITQALGGSY